MSRKQLHILFDKILDEIGYEPKRKPKGHPCPKCGKVCHGAGNLTQHLRTHKKKR